MNNRLERNWLSGQKGMSPLCNHISELKSTLSFTEISVQILHSRILVQNPPWTMVTARVFVFV